jgi:hypothetical protein
MKTDSEIINTGFESIFSTLGMVDAERFIMLIKRDLNAISLIIPNGKKTFGRMKAWSRYLRRRSGRGINLKWNYFSRSHAPHNRFLDNEHG